MNTEDLIGNLDSAGGLPAEHAPVPVAHFQPETIILTRGSLDTPARERFVRRICRVYPDARVEERLDVAHNRADLDEVDPERRHRKGKKTLVFGVLKSAVRFSCEEGNTCPNYWHFSVYGFCPFGCKYCYLAGTPGVWFSPTVKIYVNLPEILAEIGRQASRLGQPTAFYLGKLQDGLALDPLTSYASVLVPFFARHPFARQVLLTKADAVGGLLALDHGGHTILSWSLNPPAISQHYEANVPSVEARIAAMERCAERGYPVRAVVMPIIPHGDWEATYGRFLEALLSRVKLDRLTLGGICIYRHARRLMERRLGRDNVISRNIADGHALGDGRARYTPHLRGAIYGRLIDVARDVQPDLDVALCLEEPAVWDAVRLADACGHCNCVL